jgi:hypothetical protein
MLDCQLVQRPGMERCLESGAHIGKGERHTTAPCKRARDFHDRKKFFQPAIHKAAEVNWKVPIGLVEHSRPRGRMEERASGMRREERIPALIKQRIYPDRSLRAFGSLRLWGFNFRIRHDFSD